MALRRPRIGDNNTDKNNTPITDVVYIPDGNGFLEPFTWSGSAWVGGTKIALSSGLTAANVSYTPSGGIAATTVQNALNELDSEKATGDTNARVAVRKNSGTDVGTRRRINLIEGTNVTLTVTDDSVNEEVDVTVTLADGDKGDITVTGTTWTVDNNVVTHAKYQDIASSRLLGRASAGAGDPEELRVQGGIEFDGAGNLQISAFTGDVTKTAGDTVLTIANNAVTLAKFQDIAANSILGNNTGAAADPIQLTVAQTTAMLDAFTSLLKGLVPASGGGTSNFLRADGAWTAPTAAYGGGDMAPASGLTVSSGKGYYVVDEFEVANGQALDISGVFEVG